MKMTGSGIAGAEISIMLTLFLQLLTVLSELTFGIMYTKLCFVENTKGSLQRRLRCKSETSCARKPPALSRSG
jgi:hypothetical protein